MFCTDSCTLGSDYGDTPCDNEETTQYFYDGNSNECKPFQYGGCGGNGNKFATQQACQDSCGGK